MSQTLTDTAIRTAKPRKKSCKLADGNGQQKRPPEGDP